MKTDLAQYRGRAFVDMTYDTMREVRTLLRKPHPGGACSSQTYGRGQSWDGGFDYDMMVAALDKPGLTFGATIKKIDRLSSAVARAAAPPSEVPRRRRTVGRSGYAVRPTAVLRGDLAHSWKRTTRQLGAGHATHATVILPGRFYAGCSAEQVHWTMIANVALVQVLERQGTACDIWTVCVLTEPFEQSLNLYAAVHLKTAGSAWNIQDMVPVAHAAWFRRVIFRVMEECAGPYGGLVPGYGGGMQGTPLAAALQAWGARHGLGTVRLGATESDQISNEAEALAWLQTHLEP